MTKFEELFNKGIPNEVNNNIICNDYSLYDEWMKYSKETKELIEKTRNRKPIVDFKVKENNNVSTDDIFLFF